MNQDVMLSEAGFRENAQVKGFRWVAPDTLEMWYNLPNPDMAMIELRSIAAAMKGMEGFEVSLEECKGEKSHELYHPGLPSVRVRVVLPRNARPRQWDCANYEAVH